MSLRDELAERLFSLVHVFPYRLDQIPNPTRTEQEDWYKLADECLRQMEWARRNPRPLYERVMACGHAEEIRDYAELSLAPPDWQPRPKNEEKSGGEI